MASESISQLHFLLIPLLAPGHTIPMIDMAKLLAQRPNVVVTIVTTPLNAIRYGPNLQQHINSGLPVRFLELPFPAAEAGLPEGCESADALPGLHLIPNFSAAVDMLQQRLEQRFESLDPRPSCILSDRFMLWTADTAIKYQIPRIIFDGMNCFKQLCTHHLYASKVLDGLPDSEPFVLPGLPDHIEMTKVQLPEEFNPGGLGTKEQRERVRETELSAYGLVINSFEELEQEYVNEFKKLKNGRVWCLGPLSLTNNKNLGKAVRGNSTSIDEQQIVNWLDSKEPGSVIYACFGSSSQVIPPQLIELGLGLEASNRPFIWVIRAGDRAKEIEEWIKETGFEERTNGRGLLIRDWAPQLLILSHPSVGGFLTHCGWNSILEGVCAGVPLITWPLFADQFLNEKLVVQVLGVGVAVGAERVVHWGMEDKFGVMVKSEQVSNAIRKMMDIGTEGNERKKKAKLLAKVANKAIEEGGSSYKNLTLLIQDIMELANVKKDKTH
ncbi:UDP-glycosyltransferase 73C6-like [Cynara cardunculus var. scolymus]|uniref:UDP-glycosyltransferase 73C6-like n=1 Tax=Cynara cardunculus var. scolymus TaxID=59895 RepID=UPI000D62F8D5|nr:UDP-glycosyltransferase 73C6-like [Cynara cardunculus var. scolymus]